MLCKGVRKHLRRNNASVDRKTASPPEGLFSRTKSNWFASEKAGAMLHPVGGDSGELHFVFGDKLLRVTVGYFFGSKRVHNGCGPEGVLDEMKPAL